MAFQTVFKRYELKYILTLEQKKNILVSNSHDVAAMCDERYELVKISGKKKGLRKIEHSI